MRHHFFGLTSNIITQPSCSSTRFPIWRENVGDSAENKIFIAYFFTTHAMTMETDIYNTNTINTLVKADVSLLRCVKAGISSLRHVDDVYPSTRWNMSAIAVQIHWCIRFVVRLAERFYQLFGVQPSKTNTVSCSFWACSPGHFQKCLIIVSS